MEDIFKLNERKVGAPNSCFFNVVLEDYLPKAKISSKQQNSLQRKYGDGDENKQPPTVLTALNTSKANQFTPKIQQSRKPATNSLLVGITRFNEVMVETAQNCNKKKIINKEFEKATSLHQLNYIEVADETCFYI